LTLRSKPRSDRPAPIDMRASPPCWDARACRSRPPRPRHASVVRGDLGPEGLVRHGAPKPGLATTRVAGHPVRTAATRGLPHPAKPLDAISRELPGRSPSRRFSADESVASGRCRSDARSFHGLCPLGGSPSLAAPGLGKPAANGTRAPHGGAGRSPLPRRAALRGHPSRTSTPT
jgi:hypothetical protein